MEGQYLAVHTGDDAAVGEVCRAITRWDPLLSLAVTEGAGLYHGVCTGYGLCIGEASRLAFGGHEALVQPGDAVVVPPGVRVACSPPGRFLWTYDEGVPPETLREAAAQHMGFEHFPLARQSPGRSICGQRCPVIPDSDLRYRVHYHFVSIQNATPHTHSEMVELYYVLEGEGEVRVGPSEAELTTVPVRPGSLLAIGPGLFHIPTNGLGICVWFLYHEVAHRRRMREAAKSTCSR